MSDPTKRYSHLAPFAIDRQIELCIAALNFFSVTEYTQSCKAIGKQAEPRRIGSLSGQNFATYLEKVKKLGSVSDKLGTNLATLSVAWCIANPNVTTAILGATKKEQLQQNLAALELYPKLDEEIMKEIDSIMDTKPQLPEH